MRIDVDLKKCCGYGNFPFHAPTVFELDESEGIAVVLEPNPPAEHQEAARLAAADCPTDAILISET